MLYKTSDKSIAYLALISGLSISAVAIYYSVAGLMAIFAAAAIPIMIMGIVLEIGKLSATVWLKQNWTRAPKFLKTYLLLAIVTLMLLTSMGIFGYLSKAHLDQAVPTGDVAAKVALIDEKIKTERDNIETARAALKQMDAQVDARLNRSDNEQGAERAVQIRRQQQAERGRLQKDIADSQARIAKLNEERAPIASELRKVEAEVGPIKYIAALIYGDDADQNLLEKAVRWVIIVIVLVFDPLAVILLLASQYSFNWFRQQQEETPQEEQEIEDEPEPITDEMASDVYEMENVKSDPPPATNGLWPFPTVVGKKPEEKEDNVKILEEEKDPYPEFPMPVEQWNKMIEEAEKAVEEEKKKEKVLANVIWNDALQQWRDKNPNADIYEIQRSFDAGEIDVLPWDKEFGQSEEIDPVAEAKKWAEEQQEESKKKTTYIIKEGDHQIQKTKD